VDDGERTWTASPERRANVIMALLAIQAPSRAEQDPGDLAQAA
jgi:hypothetical protein